MSNYEEPQQPSALFRFIRLVFFFSIGAIAVIGISALIYSFTPVLYREYVQPVQENTQQIENLEGRLDQHQQQNIERVDDLGERVEALELQNDREKQLSADSLDRLAAVETAQAEQVLALEASAVQNQDQIVEVQSALEELQGAYDELEQNQIQLIREQGNLIDQDSDLMADLEEIQGIHEDFSNELALIRQELELLKAMELLTRARFSLLAGNLSLARADLEAARDLVTALQESAGSEQIEALVELGERLDQSLQTLAASPLSAADYLESAWQLLVEGLNREVEATPSPPAVTATPTPTGQP